MTDIFQEVEEDLRRERLKKLWDRFGIWLVAVAVLIVAIVAGWRGYEAWRVDRERAAGAAFVAALGDAESAGTVSAADELLAFAGEAPSGYAMLARFRAATAYAELGEADRAAETLSGLVRDSGVPRLYQDLAAVRLASIQLDAGDAAAAQASVEPLAADAGNPFHAAAQELMGVAAYADGDLDAAAERFSAIEEAANAQPGLRQRAALMLDLIAQTRAAPASPAEPSAEEAAQEETN